MIKRHCNRARLCERRIASIKERECSREKGARACESASVSECALARARAILCMIRREYVGANSTRVRVPTDSPCPSRLFSDRACCICIICRFDLRIVDECAMVREGRMCNYRFPDSCSLAAFRSHRAASRLCCRIRGSCITLADAAHLLLLLLELLASPFGLRPIRHLMHRSRLF